MGCCGSSPPPPPRRAPAPAPQVRGAPPKPPPPQGSPSPPQQQPQHEQQDRTQSPMTEPIPPPPPPPQPPAAIEETKGLPAADPPARPPCVESNLIAPAVCGTRTNTPITPDADSDSDGCETSTVKPFSVSCSTNENLLKRRTPQDPDGARFVTSGTNNTSCDWDVRTDATATVAALQRTTPHLRTFHDAPAAVPDVPLQRQSMSLKQLHWERERGLRIDDVQAAGAGGGGSMQSVGSPQAMGFTRTRSMVASLTRHSLIVREVDDSALLDTPGSPVSMRSGMPSLSPRAGGGTGLSPRTLHRPQSLSDFGGRLIRRESLPAILRADAHAGAGPTAAGNDVAGGGPIARAETQPRETTSPIIRLSPLSRATSISFASPPTGMGPRPPPSLSSMRSILMRTVDESGEQQQLVPALSLRKESSPKLQPVASRARVFQETPMSRRASTISLDATHMLRLDGLGAIDVASEPGTPVLTPRPKEPPLERLIHTDFEAVVNDGPEPRRYSITITACPLEPSKKKEVDTLQGTWEDTAGNTWRVQGHKCNVTLKESGSDEVHYLEDSKHYSSLDRLTLMGATILYRDWSLVAWSDGDDWQQVWKAGDDVSVYYGDDEGWFHGVIDSRAESGMYRVRFENGELRDDVEGAHMRSREGADDAEDPTHLEAPKPAWA